MPTVFVTGANRGIGLSLAKHYLKLNYAVHATYRSKESASELLSLADKNLTCHQVDVTDYDAIKALVSKLPSIDLLINNAGYYGPKGYGFGNTDIDQWRSVLEVNTIAPLKLVESFFPLLQKGRQKRIACISSKVGSMAENTSGGGYIYRSSKAALNSVVKSLSNDLSAQGFTIVALHPGWVQTEMGGPNALITTEESSKGLVQVIEGLCQSDSGRFLNYDGSEIPW